jgi:hypothetical protein
MRSKPDNSSILLLCILCLVIILCAFSGFRIRQAVSGAIFGALAGASLEADVISLLLYRFIRKYQDYW